MGYAVLRSRYQAGAVKGPKAPEAAYIEEEEEEEEEEKREEEGRRTGEAAAQERSLQAGGGGERRRGKGVRERKSERSREWTRGRVEGTW
eukprot:600955-Rhodomonas_salina.1